ncbi:MAG: hypothetical protein ACP5SH_25465 [Syntrophobacteraceae bacterium]
MEQKAFNSIVRGEMSRSLDTLSAKADEYVNGEDRLSNFKQAAVLQSCTPVQALGGMMAKHVVALFDFIARDEPDPERWTEKIGDIHNYLYLLTAILAEKGAESRPWNR